MKTRRKRLLSLLLTACMVLTMLPAVTLPALAAGHDHSSWTPITMGETYIKLNGTEQTDNTLPTGNYRLDEDITLTKYDTRLIIPAGATVNLCLNGYTINCGADSEVYVVGNKNGDPATLTLYGEGGKVTGSYFQVVYARYGNLTLENVTIENTGTTASREAVWFNGDYSYSDKDYSLTINGGTITTAGTGDGSVGVRCIVPFTMNGGEIKATGTDSVGVSCNQFPFTMNNSTVTGGAYGVRNLDEFTMNGGTVTGGTYGVYNTGAFTLERGTVTGTTAGVFNDTNSGHFTANGGAVTGETDGIFGAGNVTLNNGFTVTGKSGYAINNVYANSGAYGETKITLNGAPTLTGIKGAIHGINQYLKDGNKNHCETVIYGDSYTGDALTVDCESYQDGYEIVVGLNDTTKSKFLLAEDFNFTIEYKDGNYVTYGKPQQLTWYDIDRNVITGQADKTSYTAYPRTYYTEWNYTAVFGTTYLPNGPVVPGKLFKGWQYSVDGGSNWSTDFWTATTQIMGPTCFKPVYTDSIFDGAGTQTDPYQIKTAQDLETLADLVNYGTDYYKKYDSNCITKTFNNPDVWYKVMNDIDLSSVCGPNIGSYGSSWSPIGDSTWDGYSFLANFDGNHKVISNLYISDSYNEYKGLFGYVGRYGASVVATTIQNVVLKDVYVYEKGSAYNETAALIGVVEDGVTVKDCTVSGALYTKVFIPSREEDEAAGNIFGVISRKESTSNISGIDKSGLNIVYIGDGATRDYVRGDFMAYKGFGAGVYDIQGKYNEQWRSTTFFNYGYRLETEGLDSATVASDAKFVNGGKYVQLNYTVTADDTVGVSGGKLGVYADIKIGDNDSATVQVIQDPATGKVIGLKMVDSHDTEKYPYCPTQNAQFNLYFDGTGGVTPVDTYWFGFWSRRQDNCFTQLNQDTVSGSLPSTVDPYEHYADDLTSLSNTDSGFALSWQNINLNAGETRTFSFIIGVGEKADAPLWEKQPTGFRPVYLTDAAVSGKTITVTAKVLDADGQTDTLYYSVNDGEGKALGNGVKTDGVNTNTITETLDLSSYQPGKYTLSFWVVNTAGAASTAVSKTITITTDGVAGLDTTIPEQVTITFASGEGGSGTMNPASATRGGQYILPKCIFTAPEGKEFDAWQVGSDRKAVGDPIAVTENTTVTALWKNRVEYSISVTADLAAYGTAYASVSKSYSGETITLTATPGEGYEFDRWEVTNGGVTIGSDNTFTMPAANVEIKAHFKEKTYTVTIQNDGHGTGTASVGETAITAAKKDAQITLTSAPAPGYTFKEWQVVSGGVTITDGTFTMPAANVTVKATFEAIPYAVTVLNGDNGTAKAYVGENACTTAIIGTKVTLKATPDAGYQLKEWQVKDAAGKSITVTSNSFNMPASDVTVTTVFEKKVNNNQGHTSNDNPAHNCPSLAYSDLDVTKWYHLSTDYVIANGLMNGVGDGKFTPHDTTTRGMIVTILYRLEGKPGVSGDCPFNDVKAGSWYEDVVAWAEKNGIVEGYGNGKFGPEDTITREQMATILYRYAEYKGYDVTGKADLTKFTDSDEISTWAKTALSWANANGLVEGDGSKLMPKGDAERCQIAAILHRFCENIAK